MGLRAVAIILFHYNVLLSAWRLLYHQGCSPKEAPVSLLPPHTLLSGCQKRCCSLPASHLRGTEHFRSCSPGLRGCGGHKHSKNKQPVTELKMGNVSRSSYCVTEDIPSTRLEEMRKEVAQLWGRKASTEVSRCSTNPKNKTHKTLKKKKKSPE